MRNLRIPDRAYEAGEHALQRWPIADSDMIDAASEVIDASADLIVVAELYTLADDIAGRVSADDNVTEFHVNQVCAAKIRARADELNPRPTVADVARNPSYWIAGLGHARAWKAKCDHGYRLTDSCPGCDAS